MTYKERETIRRKEIIDILNLAKKNGCDAYIVTQKAKEIIPLDYGYIIFPDNVIMYIQCSPTYGWNFAIEYVPSNGKETGCICSKKAETIITWDRLLELRESGLKYAKELKANFYETIGSWKKANEKFKATKKI